MKEMTFYDYAEKFGVYKTHSMFGGIGLFLENCMYALIADEQLYLRGSERLDKELIQLGCSRFRHRKKRGVVTVNYYNISMLYESGYVDLDNLIRRSIAEAFKDKKQANHPRNRRIRDLPNMRLTLERMLNKSGINDVDGFIKAGAVESFRKVQHQYGGNVDINLLWKFSGAIEGKHWMLICDTTKKTLRRAIDTTK